jgi:DNA invertase Pin-like site-specific DNA recombinase
LDRQKIAVRDYAQKNNIEITKEYYDAAVKGADSVMDRPQFSEMLGYMMANGIEIILVETANRFARDLIVQLTGHDFLKENGITLIPTDAPDHFTDETPTAILIRQVLGAVAEFQKRNLVEVMQKGRLKKRRETGRCEGRKPPPQEAIEQALKLKEDGLSLRAISASLAESGFFVMVGGKSTGKPYTAASIKYMIDNFSNEETEQ